MINRYLFLCIFFLSVALIANEKNDSLTIKPPEINKTDSATVSKIDSSLVKDESLIQSKEENTESTSQHVKTEITDKLQSIPANQSVDTLRSIGVAGQASPELSKDSLEVIEEKKSEKLVKEIEPYSREGIKIFADKLYSFGEYRRAATEYLRLYSLYPEMEGSLDALFSAILCFEKSGNYDDAIKFCGILKDRSENPTHLLRIEYRENVNLFLNNKIETVMQNIESSDFAEDYSMQYLKGFAMLRQRDYQSAESLLVLISEGVPTREISTSSLFLLSKSKQGQSLSQRSPFLAATLSTLVPGMGRAYCNNWGDAVFSFLTIAATIGPAVYYWDEDPTFAITTGIIGAFFYIGNIYGSASGALNYNDEEHYRFYRQTYDGVPYPPESINIRLD